MRRLNSTSPSHRQPREETQPLHALQVQDALLKLSVVRGVTGLSASSIYRLARRGELVPIKMGARCTRWRAGDVRVWLAAR